VEGFPLAGEGHRGGLEGCYRMALLLDSLALDVEKAEFEERARLG
jgi:hypothetical protein